MAKGAEAKAYAIEKIKEAFGADFICEYDKKLYINCPEAGGKVQVAISLTCPKIPISTGVATRDGGMDFENVSVMAPAVTVEITDEEKENIQRLLAMVN